MKSELEHLTEIASANDGPTAAKIIRIRDREIKAAALRYVQKALQARYELAGFDGLDAIDIVRIMADRAERGEG